MAQAQGDDGDVDAGEQQAHGGRMSLGVDGHVPGGKRPMPKTTICTRSPSTPRRRGDSRSWWRSRVRALPGLPMRHRSAPVVVVGQGVGGDEPLVPPLTLPLSPLGFAYGIRPALVLVPGDRGQVGYCGR